LTKIHAVCASAANEQVFAGSARKPVVASLPEKSVVAGAAN
jgi:hypothetical protein